MNTENRKFSKDINPYMGDERISKEENRNIIKNVFNCENINTGEVNIPRNEISNVDEENILKDENSIVPGKNVWKEENSNVDEENILKVEKSNVSEENIPKEHNSNIVEENISKKENSITSKRNVPKEESSSMSDNISKEKNSNMGEKNVPKKENSSIAEENISKEENSNKRESNVLKNENSNIGEEILSVDESSNMDREKVLKIENRDIDQEKMSNNKTTNVDKGKVSKTENHSIKEEMSSNYTILYTEIINEQKKGKLGKYKNPSVENVLTNKNISIIVNVNESKDEHLNIDNVKSKHTDEKDKESASTLLSGTLRAFINPKSSDSGTVSVPLPPPEDTSSTVSNSSLDDAAERGTWSRQLDFFLSCVGYAVGLGNIWRFPYLCYRSGGGAFLVPYLLFLIICGMPLFFLEMSFGQFASLGPIAIWKICPLFKGLGYGMVIISGIVCIYYNVIIAWTLYYIYQSVTVPWKTCKNVWNTENCVDSSGSSTISTFVNSSTFFNETSSDTMLNTTVFNSATLIGTMFNGTLSELNPNRTTSSQEFWLRYVLRQSSGIDNLGELQLPLVLTLFLAWVVVFLCLQKGVKSSGKVVYFSATFPYVVLVILLIRGLTLPGAWKGIAFYLSPRWEHLMSFKVWADAATQIFYSVGAAWGAILTMASYNKFSNNVYRDSLLIPLINCGTSIFAGLVVFAIIGFMSYETGKPIESVVDEGPGLAFIVYPEAVARLPLSPIWAILFFIMLFTIGLDSQFGMFETAVSAFVDEFPSLLKKRKTLFTAFLCFVLFILGLPCVTQGGIYILQLMDWYSATFSLMIISLLETIVIGYIYGINRFLQDISLMIKRTPPFWWKLCWCVITPGTIIALLVFIFINHQPVTYNTYVYPEWSIVVGWLIAFCSIVPIPLTAVVQIAKAEGTLKERVISCLRPSPEWGPALEENRILYKKSLSTVASNFPQKHFSGLAHSASNNHMAEESGLCMVQKDEAPNQECSV